MVYRNGLGKIVEFVDMWVMRNPGFVPGHGYRISKFMNLRHRGFGAMATEPLVW